MLDNIPYLPYFISAFIGIGLAAASGFRVFLPMFAVSLASYMGWIPMNENFQWLAGLPTLITTGIATVVEILAYYIPYVDHLLDTASVPLATIAGSIMFAAQFTDLGTFPTWALALIAGGGTAAAISSGFSDSNRASAIARSPPIIASVLSRSSLSETECEGFFKASILSWVVGDAFHKSAAQTTWFLFSTAINTQRKKVRI